MKKIMISIIVLLSLLIFSFSEATQKYNNENGAILSQEEREGIRITVRKFEINIVIGDLASDNDKIIYDDYRTKKIIGKLEINDEIRILEVLRIDYLTESSKDDKVRGEIWYKITYKSKTGWICITSDYIGSLSDPYYENRWEIIEIIDIGGKKWTVRTLEENNLFIWVKLNIRDKPGLIGTKVLYVIPAESIIHVYGMTQETEVIDGKTDHWLKIKYKDNIGWIFGGYAYTNSGGPKYLTPEIVARVQLGYY